MKKLFKLFIVGLIALFAYTIDVSSQVFNMSAYEMCYKPTGGSWSAWQDVEIRIVANDYYNTIVVYSQQTQNYKISYQEKNGVYDSDGDLIYSWKCVDLNRNVYCRIKVIKRFSDDGKVQLYLEYADIKVCYNVTM